MYTIFIACIVIVIAVLLLSVLTTSKAYSYKHTVDPLENNPHVDQEKDQNNHSRVKKNPIQKMNRIFFRKRALPLLVFTQKFASNLLCCVPAMRA